MAIPFRRETHWEANLSDCADGATALLGINRTTFLTRMKKFGIYTKQHRLTRRFPLSRSPPESLRHFQLFRLLQPRHFRLLSSSPENSATYDLVSLARVLPLPHVEERNAQERGHYAAGFDIPPQVEQVLPRSTVSPRIRTFGFRALWAVAGAQLTGRCCRE
jgi:hypothetical protein